MVTESLVETSTEYRTGDPVLVVVRSREHRFDLSDGAGAIERAGKPAGWLVVAQAVVATAGFNVNRRGVVFVPAVAGRDIDGLTRRLAEVSREVYLAVLELG